MFKSFFRFIAVLLITCLIADPATATSLSPTSVTAKRPLIYSNSQLEEEALAAMPAFVMRCKPFTKMMKAIRHESSKKTHTGRDLRKQQRIWVLVGGTIGLVLLLAASPSYKDWVMRWADGSERLTFLSLVPISMGYALFVSILSQAYLANESIKEFRLDWVMVARSIGLAALFSTPFEGGYYERWLPAIIPGEGWLIALGRAALDQIFSILFLDAINQYFQAWIVEGETREEAMHDIHLYTLRFFSRSFPLWLSTVFLANLFSRPIINFSIINIGMIIWDFQLNISIHDTTPNAAGIKPRSRWRSWSRFMRFYDRKSNELLERRLFKYIKTLHRQKWYEKALLGIAISGLLYQLGWLTYPLWAYILPIAVAVVVMVIPILRHKIFQRGALLERSA